ncbi:unnamed protein product [Mytilus coruscus]|uniref:Uncharacterized protein n=1 Tax=Mytilus coruscus TaxID=42192 RepID=A0A6J8EGG6_MYTCO|nr:unnamed protein product [Mytilus coruscus]
MSTITEEEENYARMSLLLSGVSQRAARVFFDSVFHPSCLDRSIKGASFKLGKLKYKTINLYQWDLLFPGQGDLPDSKTFDVTLIITLLRNLADLNTPQEGFDNLPSAADITPSADLATIKHYRNCIAHNIDGKIKRSLFNQAWNDISGAVGRLGCKTMLDECEELRTKILERSTVPWNVRVEHKIVHQRKGQTIGQYTNESQQIVPYCRSEYKAQENTRGKDLTIALKTGGAQQVRTMPLDRIPVECKSSERRYLIEHKWSTSAQINHILEKWKIEEGNFIMTRASKYVFECVQENSCVTITACSGVGKTATLRYVVLKMIGEGYDAVLVTNPQDIVRYHNPNQKTLFVIDDLCGTYSINQSDLDSWESVIDRVKENIQNKVTKIIVACRLQVYQDGQFEALSIFTTNVCNLLSKDLCLTHIEKQSIAELYLKNNLQNENPEKHNISDFFKNPYLVFETEIDQLKKRHYKKYCALALCVMFNNALKEQLFTDEIDIATTTVIENTCLACRLDKGTSRIALLDELKSLEHMFIKNEQGVYKAKHDKLFDLLTYYFGKEMIQCLICNAHSQIISQKMLFDETYYIDRLITIVPPKFHDHYIQRIIDDWLKGRLRYIFNNINLKIQQFSKIFLFKLYTLDISFQNQLAFVRDNKDNGTVLLHCCYSGVLLSLIQEVLNRGVDVNLCNCLGVSPLLGSVMRGHTEFVKLLLDNMADTNKCESKGLSPLYAACQTGQMEVVKLLLDNKADINKCLYNGASSLYIACQEKRIEIVKLLLDNKADIDQCLFNGISPLYLACKDNYIEVVKILTENKADTNKCTDDGTSPLYIACQNNHIEIVQILLDNKADVNKCRDNGKFPLYVACNYNHIEIVKILLDDKADINKCDTDKQSPLFLACGLNHREIVQLLLDNKADINKCRDNGMSPLYIASVKNHIEVVKLLLYNKADINKCDDYGHSPLYISTHWNRIELVKLLMDTGADINMCDFQGKSPLFIALKNKHIEVVKLLLDNADLLEP